MNTLREILTAGYTGHCDECGQRTFVGVRSDGVIVCWRCHFPATDIELNGVRLDLTEQEEKMSFNENENEDEVW